jgi:hypothetical protein
MAVHALVPASNVAYGSLAWKLSGLSIDKSSLEWALAMLRALEEDCRAGMLESKPPGQPVRRWHARSEVSVSGNENVIATGSGITINITGSRARVAKIVVTGTVAENKTMIGYLKYLVERYQEFKLWECKKNGHVMKYQMIHVAYKRELKYRLSETPLELFEQAVEFLQRRIRNSMLGRTRQSQKLFSAYDEFCEHSHVQV